MPRLYDHIDLRVPSLAEARTFYESLLPALGFIRKTEIPGWLQYEAEAPDGGAAAFFGVTESTGHVPNASRIAFWVENTSELDRLTYIVACAGARNLEGPGWEDETYYAAFFEDPCGNRLELCHRTAPVKLQAPTDFEGTMNDDSGKTVAIRHKAVEVLRCQPDGTWKLIVGDPTGRE